MPAYADDLRMFLESVPLTSGGQFVEERSCRVGTIRTGCIDRLRVEPRWRCESYSPAALADRVDKRTIATQQTGHLPVFVDWFQTDWHSKGAIASSFKAL